MCLKTPSQKNGGKVISNPWIKPEMWRLITNKVKLPIEALFRAMDKILPEPTKETVRLRNSKLLVQIKDEFFEHLNLTRDYHQPKVRAFRGMWKVFIIMYDADNPYTQMLNWVCEKLVSRYGDWQPRPDHEPDSRIWKGKETPELSGVALATNKGGN